MLQHFGKWLGNLLELNTMTQQLYSREMSAYIHQKTYLRMFLAALYAVGWRQPKKPLTV